jgi:hypothetical protein
MMFIKNGVTVNELPPTVLEARAKADAAADAQLAVWDRLPAEPSHDDISEWVIARDKFQAAQAHFLLLLWKWQIRQI